MKLIFRRFQKLVIVLLLLLFNIFLISCKPESTFPADNNKQYRTDVLEDVSEVILAEEELGFKFFWETANNDLDSPGYGLIPDRFNTISNTPYSIASIASVGFGLTAIPIGIENEWITRTEGEERAYYTLVSLEKMERHHGFWYHFVNIKSGKRAWDSEVSIIDSAILINGVLTVGQYFGGRVQELAFRLYEKIEWKWYFDSKANKFYMGYWPEKGFEGHWNGYAEQLMVYVLAAGSPKYSVDKSAYTLMKYNSVKINSSPEYGSFYATHTGSIFNYQFSHAWIDFRSYEDESGVNWYQNSVNAVDAAIYYATTQTSIHPGINENSWGMSACDGPDGYKGDYGSGPSAGNVHFVDGTVPAYGAIASVVFNADAAIRAAENYYTYPRFWSKYGFKDAYNLSVSESGWFAQDIIGIDKGISLLMIENYLSKMIWKIFMEIDYIQTGLQKLGFSEIDG